MTKLIILRGPSGAGKSTVAKALQAGATRKVALIDQDYYKEFMLKPKEDVRADVPKFILDNILLGLRLGYDVIIDGIFESHRYGNFFDPVFVKHPKENYMFYFDVSLDETLRRHQTRPQKEHFGEAEMRDWYSYSDRSKHAFEEVIPESSSLEETISTIRKATRL